MSPQKGEEKIRKKSVSEKQTTKDHAKETVHSRSFKKSQSNGE